MSGGRWGEEERLVLVPSAFKRLLITGKVMHFYNANTKNHPPPVVHFNNLNTTTDFPQTTSLFASIVFW